MISLELSDKEKENLTYDEIEVAKARKLELLILPHLKRNINFFYAGANIPKKYEAYNTQMDTQVLEENIRNNASSLPAVCKPLCDMMVEILKENGLNAETVSCDTDMFRHVDVLLTTSSGKKYIINYLEDMENIQSGMKTPDFASEKYYERRYKKFEDGVTTDGKDLKNISFLAQERLEKIDENIGYKKYGLYMDQVIEEIRKEFENFRIITAENEYLTEECRLEKSGEQITEEIKKDIKSKIEHKYQNMEDTQILEKKLDWIFDYFNQRMDITGHTDFVMYYSRLLLKQVLSPEEYKKLTRYDCFVNKDEIPEESNIKDILNFENSEDETKMRFCLLGLGEKAYAFSTKPNVYEKLDKEELEKLSKYANISKSQKPSDLVLKLCDRGNALPLIFHPLGQKLLNNRASLIDRNLSESEIEKQTQELANSIKTTDGEVTSITIPYPDGRKEYIYINSKKEFTVKTDKETIIYHYNDKTDSFKEERVDEGR